MATGCTSKIHDGDQSFEDFVLTCARAFGGYIEQGDNLSDCHEKSLNQAKKDLELFNSTSPEKHHRQFLQYIADSRESNNKAVQENLALKSRNQKMLDKVKNWKCPSAKHVELKKFMIEQLESSIDCDYDCDFSYYDRANKELENLEYEDWLKYKLTTIENNIKYHTEENKKELKDKNREERNKSSLYKSLGLKVK